VSACHAERKLRNDPEQGEAAICDEAFQSSTVSATDLMLSLVMTEDCALSNIRIPSFRPRQLSVRPMALAPIENPNATATSAGQSLSQGPVDLAVFWRKARVRR
jgi:hypothetical protein